MSTRREKRYKLLGIYECDPDKKGHREIFYFARETKGEGLTINDILKIDQVNKLDQIISNDYFKESSK